MAKKLLIRQVRSALGRKSDQRRTLIALGLRRVHQQVEKPDIPQIRGMIEKVSHLVEVMEIE